MSNAAAGAQDDDLEPEDVDLDLDAEDMLLREAIGQPITVKVGGKIITVPHTSEWPHIANTAAGRADFGTWAAAVLSDADFETFTKANLKNYQMTALFSKIHRRTGSGPGKSPSSRGSSKSTRRR
jgi:hypothetical protein